MKYQRDNKERAKMFDDKLHKSEWAFALALCARFLRVVDPEFVRLFADSTHAPPLHARDTRLEVMKFPPSCSCSLFLCPFFTSVWDAILLAKMKRKETSISDQFLYFFLDDRFLFNQETIDGRLKQGPCFSSVSVWSL